MLKWLIHRKLRAFERQHGYDASYLHAVLDTDLDAFRRFERATDLSQYRKAVPRDVYFGARLTASMLADCGACTQLGVGFALQAGVPASTVAAVVARDDASLPADVALGVRFARAVLGHAAETEQYRQEIAQRWGRQAVLALAFAAMSAQLYPTLKYALGYGKACTRVVVEGKPIVVQPLAASAA